MDLDNFGLSVKVKGDGFDWSTSKDTVWNFSDGDIVFLRHTWAERHLLLPYGSKDSPLRLHSFLRREIFKNIEGVSSQDIKGALRAFEEYQNIMGKVSGMQGQTWSWGGSYRYITLNKNLVVGCFHGAHNVLENVRYVACMLLGDIDSRLTFQRL